MQNSTLVAMTFLLWCRLADLLVHFCELLLWISCLTDILIPETSQHLPSGRYRPAPPRRTGGKPKPPWVKEAALELFACGSHSIRSIRDNLNRLYARQGISVGISTVYGWVKRYSHQALSAKRYTRNRLPKPIPANRCWGLDMTGKGDQVILGIIDHGTRLNVALTRLERANTKQIVEQLDGAIAQFGSPDKIITDNASVFRSKAFRQAMTQRGIWHKFIPPGQPWKNGRIERFFLTLKQKLDRIVPSDNACLDNLLAEFRLWYNAVRPHQHLHGHTPWEAWNGVNPYNTTPLSVTPFEGWDGLLKGYYLRF
ncbi:transposase family protein [Chitinimonas arctica]|uniref:Transposase family protein n=1 Tax=Chitinimonas arctica TaxID=2594795 RepID=A0A516SGL8_9NEIS|nr:integrase core domain-containing protein [Chitinimonas arctica]QDQ27306.1 transposase family protein [Chitinimonas arctica]